MGSASKVVDCILSLKALKELKQMNNENGSNKHIRSPLLLQSASRTHLRVTAAFPSDACRRVDLSATVGKTPHAESNFQKREGLIIQSCSHIFVSNLHLLVDG